MSIHSWPVLLCLFAQFWIGCKLVEYREDAKKYRKLQAQQKRPVRRVEGYGTWRHR